MPAFNVVKFKVKAGHEEDFVAWHRERREGYPGFRRVILLHTGERHYTLIGEWDDMQSIADARPAMVASLDRFRDKLEDLGGGLGVTDPVSGEAIVDYRP